jgi:hypothetical protein
MSIGDKRYVAATAAITAARASSRNELLSPESETAVASVASFYGNNDFVYEHRIFTKSRICKPVAAGLTGRRRRKRAGIGRPALL